MHLLLLPALAGPVMSKAVVGYPPGGSGEQTCQAQLVVDKTGKVEHTLVWDCPATFAAKARDALRLWRYEPDEAAMVDSRTILFKQSSPYAREREGGVLRVAVEEHLVDVHRSEHEATTRVDPKFPTDAAGLSGKCIATIVVPVEGGSPADVTVEDCDEKFFKATRMALYDWEFPPWATDSAAQWVRTRIPLTFEEPPDPEPLPPTRYASLLVLEDKATHYFPREGRKHSPATCTAQLTVTEKSRIKDVEIVGCHPVFHVAAENAVRRYVYTHKGEPTELRVAETLEFVSKKDERASTREEKKRRRR